MTTDRNDLINTTTKAGAMSFRTTIITSAALAALVIPTGAALAAHAQEPTPSATPTTTASPTPSATATSTPSATATASPTTGAHKRVTATYGCRTATFHNPNSFEAWVIYGVPQSGDVEGRVTLAPGGSATITSKLDRLGWTAWKSPGQEVVLSTQYIPGGDLTKGCKTTPKPTASATTGGGSTTGGGTTTGGTTQTRSGGLASTGV